MKLKDFLIPLMLAIGVTMTVQHFFIDRKKDQETAASGRVRVAPRVQEVHRPLNLDVDFGPDTLVDQKATLTTIDTDYAQFVFTTDGGALDRVSFKHVVGGNHNWLTAALPQERDQRSFLVALDDNTPFHYTLAHVQDGADQAVVEYSASCKQGLIRKRFTIFKHECKVDVALSIEYTGKNTPIRLRLLCPSPAIVGLTDDVIKAVIYEEKRLNKRGMTELGQLQYWENPSVFGLEDRYFVYALINNPDNFVQRGFYKVIGTSSVLTILESKEIADSAQNTLSFYFGPKQASQFQLVDPRLEPTLEYGWFAPVSLVFLKILNWLNDYTRNYGLAIILLTLLIKLFLLPFTWGSEAKMSRQKSDYERKLRYIQQKYKHDPEMLMREKAEFVRTHGVPGGMAGCLPLLLQIPLFLALSNILSRAVELYQAPFYWIPNLADKDPYYILPMIVVGTMVLHSMVSSAKGSDVRQQMTSIAVALVFGAFSASFAAGLSLYLSVNMLATVAQTYLHGLFKRHA